VTIKHGLVKKSMALLVSPPSFPANSGKRPFVARLLQNTTALQTMHAPAGKSSCSPSLRPPARPMYAVSIYFQPAGQCRPVKQKFKQRRPARSVTCLAGRSKLRGGPVKQAAQLWPHTACLARFATCARRRPAAKQSSGLRPIIRAGQAAAVLDYYIIADYYKHVINSHIGQWPPKR